MFSGTGPVDYLEICTFFDAYCCYPLGFCKSSYVVIGLRSSEVATKRFLNSPKRKNASRELARTLRTFSAWKIAFEFFSQQFRFRPLLSRNSDSLSFERIGLNLLDSYLILFLGGGGSLHALFPLRASS